MYGILLSQTVPNADLKLPLSKCNGITLGKKGALRVTGVGVSKQHCNLTFEKESETVFVTDCSVNGTFINGVLIGRENTRKLVEGDLLSFAVASREDALFDAGESAMFVYHALESKKSKKPTLKKKKKKKMSRKEKTRLMNSSPMRSRLKTGLELERFLKRGPSTMVPENASPEDMSRLLKVNPSASIFSALRSKLKENSREWLRLFADIGGLEQLCSLFRMRSRTNGEGVMDVLESIELLANEEFGVRCAIETPGLIQDLALCLDSQNSDVRKSLFLLLAAVCVYSPEGYSVVLAGVDARGKRAREGRRFKSIVRELATSIDPLHKSAVLTLINHLTNFPDSLQARVAMRDCFFKLNILNLLAGMELLECPELDRQVCTFVDWMDNDKAARGPAASETATALSERIMRWAQSVSDKEVEHALATIEKNGGDVSAMLTSVAPAATSIDVEERQRHQRQLIDLQKEFDQKMQDTQAKYEHALRNLKRAATTVTPGTPKTPTAAPQFRLATPPPDSPFGPVLQQLRSPYCAPPPAPPPPGAPPAPPPPSSSLSLSAIVDVPRSRFKPSVPVRQLYWSKVPTHAAANTVWTKLDWVELDIEKEHVEKLFSVRPPPSSSSIASEAILSEESTSASEVVTANQKVRFFDMKRANNIGIMMSQFRSMGVAGVKRAILSLDTEELTLEKLAQLRRYSPDSDEEQLLLNYTGEWEKLGKVEQFFLRLLDVPRLRSRLEAIIFRMRFEEVVEEVETHLSLAISACKEVMCSASLRSVLAEVLALGNFMNKTPALGFKLAFLSKLGDTRSADRKTTFLHYLAQVLHKKHPDFSQQLYNEMASVEAASKGPLEATVAELGALSTGLQLVLREIELARPSASEDDQFSVKMSHFAESASERLMHLQAMAKTVEREFADVRSFFALGNTAVFHQTMGIWTDLLLRLESAQKDNEREAREEERRAKRLAARAAKENDGSIPLSDGKTSDPRGHVLQDMLKGKLGFRPSSMYDEDSEQ